MSNAANEAEARAQIAQLGRRDFQEWLGELQHGSSSRAENPGSYACQDCTGCVDCNFCKRCEGCTRCTHCADCARCHGCSHCVSCTGCHGCSHCVQSEQCTGSAYLVMCRDMSDCTYCFGCVGLSRKDFHVLNVPFSRTEYFEVVARLKRELGL